MRIFGNRPDIFKVLFGHDKQNLVLFISVFLKNRAVSYSKPRCLEGVFFTKCRHIFIAEFHRTNCLPGNNEF